MAIQIRRGTESGWELNHSDVVVGEPVIATDTERFFIGTGTGTYAEFINISLLAPPYDSSVQWYEGQYCTKDGKMYVASADTTGAWDSTKWSVANLNDIISGLSNSRNIQTIVRTEERSLRTEPIERDEIEELRELAEELEREAERESAEEPVEESAEEEPTEEVEEETEEPIEEPTEEVR